MALVSPCEETPESSQAHSLSTCMHQKRPCEYTVRKQLCARLDFPACLTVRTEASVVEAPRPGLLVRQPSPTDRVSSTLSHGERTVSLPRTHQWHLNAAQERDRVAAMSVMGPAIKSPPPVGSTHGLLLLLLPDPTSHTVLQGSPLVCSSIQTFGHPIDTR